tara:strand:- start:111 stop:476 length:366 start_codon:yes stop_codon:yes gene_type:complete
MNNTEEKNVEPEIFIGQGVTYSIGCDCYPYSIINISGDIVTIQRDNYKPTANFDYYNDQKYVYYANPEGATESIKLYYDKPCKEQRWIRVYKNEKTGRWNKGSRSGFFNIGHRRFYQDPSF